MAADTEQREILAELRELKAEFAAVHKRLDKLDTIDKTTKRTERKADRGFATVTDTLAWQELIQNLMLYGFCLAAVGAVTSIGMIRSEVCPKAPSWALHLIPFGRTVCAGTTDKIAEQDPSAVDRPEIMAFLDTIAYAEGTEGDAGYKTIFTHAKFSGFDDHPRQIKCSGDLCSDASGRYQFLSTTWDSQARALNLPDFSPRSQDLAAIQLLKSNGAYDLILKGDIEGAIRSAAPIWASFPGAGYNQPEKAMNRLLEVYRDRLARRQSQSSSTAATSGRTVPFKGITVTSARDSSGEPGLDYVVSNGQRGAEFGALVPGVVVEVDADQNWESHLEAGDTQRGYGNLVVVRATDEASGEEVDMLYAHLDRIDVKEGDRVGVGTVLGTQGRTGSTTGPHVSVDFFAPGTRSPNAVSLAMRDRIAGILQNNPELLNAQIPSAQPAPIDKPAADPQAAASSAPNSFVSTDPDRFTVEVWIQTDSGAAPASGIIIQQDGLILTAHHVIANGFLYIKTKDGQQYRGRTIASDVSLDLALVQLDGAANLPVAPLADSANVKPGDAVQAVGSPEGSHWKHTEAQVINPKSVCGLKALDGRCIRTPAGFLLPGNSGGPLLNDQGKVIGINRAIAETNGEGVSIPIEIFKQEFKMP